MSQNREQEEKEMEKQRRISKNLQILLYSTGNYIQYPVINLMEKNIKKNAYTCITESLCCTAEIKTL